MGDRIRLYAQPYVGDRISLFRSVQIMITLLHKDVNLYEAESVLLMSQSIALISFIVLFMGQGQTVQIPIRRWWPLIKVFTVCFKECFFFRFE